MSSMDEASLLFFSSIQLPSSTANTIFGALILTTATALIIHHISPMRLTRLLVALMHETDATYIGAIEAGVIPCDVDTEALSKSRSSTKTASETHYRPENARGISPGPLVVIIPLYQRRSGSKDTN
ncbi:hypothetical protein C8J57DRAFT_1520618 [Mycena rebaudengoi]|nr:hypothetical protein C8J57DRAFT_1520618 [Mycena rebaudengoi]